MIRLKNVTKEYGEQVAVNSLNLEIKEGELCILLGPSGCGKSTTVRLINKLIPVTKGEILVNGKNIDEYDLEELRKGIGYVVQSIGLFPHMTVKDNISIVLKLQKWEKEKIEPRVREMLQLVGLDPEKYMYKHPSELSGGEAQRVGVARALASNPPILLMDEPFGAVDPLNRKRLQMEFLKIQKELKKTVVFVTHDVEEAIIMGDKIAIMNHGKLEEYDSAQGLILRNDSKFAKQFLGTEYAIKVLVKYNVKSIMRKDGAIDLNNTLPDTTTIMGALSHMIEHSCKIVTIVDADQKAIGTVDLDDVINALREIEDAGDEENM